MRHLVLLLVHVAVTLAENANGCCVALSSQDSSTITFTAIFRSGWACPMPCGNMNGWFVSQSSNMLATATAPAMNHQGEVSFMLLYRADLDTTFELRRTILPGGAAPSSCRKATGTRFVGTHICVGSATTEGGRSQDYRIFNGTWQLGNRTIEEYRSGDMSNAMFLSVDVAGGCVPVTLVGEDLIMVIKDFKAGAAVPASTFEVPAECADAAPWTMHSSAQAHTNTPRGPTAPHP